MKFLDDGVDCFAWLLLYGANFVTGEFEVTSWCHIGFEICPVCAEFFFSSVDSVHVKARSQPLSPDQISRKLICSSSLFSFNEPEKYSGWQRSLNFLRACGASDEDKVHTGDW